MSECPALTTHADYLLKSETGALWIAPLLVSVKPRCAFDCESDRKNAAKRLYEDHKIKRGCVHCSVTFKYGQTALSLTKHTYDTEGHKNTSIDFHLAAVPLTLAVSCS